VRPVGCNLLHSTEPDSDTQITDKKKGARRPFSAQQV
jgi:hypothetical protein